MVKYSVILFALIFGACMPSSARSLSSIITNGKSHYVIVLRSNASEAEKTASEELRDGIKQISGAGLKIVSESDYNSGPMIAVGFNSKLQPALSPARFGKLGEEEILIQPCGYALLLAGGSPRGTLYAVYEYLHQLGVRYYSPTYTKFPTSKTISMPAPYRYNPPVRARSILVGNGSGPQWQARNRMNSIALWTNPGDKYGGGPIEGPDMHTYWRMVTPDVLREHPDWAAEVDGKRLLPAGNTSWGLCLKPEVRAYLVQRELEYARANPDVHTIWIGFNDGSPYCTCDYCKAFYAKHGGAPSSLLLQAANELADAIGAEMPGKMVKTFAYAWSTEPPTGMKARDNVVVMFCAYTPDYILPIATSPASAEFRKNADGWKKVCRNLSVYLYAYPAERYWFPTPCLYSFAQNVQWAYRTGINDIYMQISGFAGTYGSESMDMRAWVYSRMMWDPKSDYRKLVREFARDNYGPAANAVIEAIERDLKNAVDEHGRARHFTSGLSVPDCVNPAAVRATNIKFEQIHGKLKDEDTRKRFEFFWIPYLWADIWSGFTQIGKYDAASSTWSVPMKDGELRNHYAKLAKQFMIEHNINGLREGIRMNPGALAIDKMGVAWKANQPKDSKASVVVVPGVGGNLYDLRLNGSDFKPLKSAWMFTMSRYPLQSAWYDLINGDYVPAYTVKSSSASSVILESKNSSRSIQKSINVTGGCIQVELEGKTKDNSPLKIESHLMFDMLPTAFGDAPEVYVEKTDGKWSKTVLGQGLGDFWYAGASIDTANATGRIIAASGTRPEGVLLTFDPAQLDKLRFEYDRYDYPAGLGHMFELIFDTTSRLAAADDTLRLNVSAQIVGDARKFAERNK